MIMLHFLCCASLEVDPRGAVPEGMKKASRPLGPWRLENDGNTKIPRAIAPVPVWEKGGVPANCHAVVWGLQETPVRDGTSPNRLLLTMQQAFRSAAETQ
jgi:hypothetical protein